MNKKLTIYCIFSLLLGTLIYTLQYFNIQLPKIINNYLNDFLIIPIVLFACLIVLRWTRNDKKFTLSLSIIVYVCFIYSILFEFVFPKYLTRYTSDFVDVLLYFASGIIFFTLQNKPLKKN
jgi:Ca2+/H+ antiporter